MGKPVSQNPEKPTREVLTEQLGEDYLMKVKNQTELRKVKKEISELKKRLSVLQDRKTDLEESLKK